MSVEPGSADVTTYFAMRLAADGTAATGLTITNFDLQYVRNGAAPSAKVDATALGSTGAAHGDNQAIEVDATDQPGLYRVDWPDAAFAAGVREVILTVKCATAFTEHLRIDLTAPAVNVTEWNGTAVPTPDTAGYPICTVKDGTNQGEILTASGAVTSVTTTATATAVTTVNGLAANVITAASINADAITEAKIADNAIATEHIATGAISADSLATDTITNAKIAAGAITSSEAPNLDAAITTRSSHAAADIWAVDATTQQTQGTFGQAIGDPGADADTLWGLANTNLDATVSSRSSHTANNVRDAILSDSTPFNGANIDAAITTRATPAEVATALTDIQLDHLINASGGAPANDSLIALLAASDTPATWASYDNTTDSLEAITDSGGGGPTAVQIRQEMDSNSTQLAAIVEDTGTTLQAELDGIQADTEDLQTQIGAAGAGLSAVPWNAAWDAQVESECTDALNTYDPPTKTEMDTAHGLLATEAKQDVSDANVVLILEDTGTTIPATLAALPTTAEVNTEVDTALSDIGLDHLLGASVIGTDVTDDSIIAKLVSKEVVADWDDFVNTTDSLQAIADSGGGGPTAVQIRQEMDSNSTQLAAIVEDTGTTLQAELDGIQADTEDIQTQIGTAGAGLTNINLPDQIMNITGDITGNLSGSVGSVSGHTPQTADHTAAIAALPTTAEVNAEVDTALSDIGLDHLLNAAVIGTDITDNSVIAKLVSKEVVADWDDFDNTTDSLQAISDSGGGGPTAVQIRQEMDSNSTQLAAIVADTDELQTDWANAGRLDAILDIIAADTTTDIPALIAALPTAVENRTEMDSNSTQLTAIVADTDELQGDWANTGRLDTILDTIAADTTTDLPALIAALPTAVENRTEMDSNSTQLAAIVLDTGTTLQAELDGIQADTEDIQTQIGTAGAGLTDLGGMSTTMKAQVNTELGNVMTTDTMSEEGQGIPPAEPTFKQGLMYLYMALRNKVDVTSSTKEFHDDASTVIWKKALTDDATTYSEAEGASGP